MAETKDPGEASLSCRPGMDLRSPHFHSAEAQVDEAGPISEADRETESAHPTDDKRPALAGNGSVDPAESEEANLVKAESL